MKLASAPRCLRDGFDVLLKASVAELSIEPVYIRHDKTMGRAVAGARPLLGVMPLKRGKPTLSGRSTSKLKARLVRRSA